MHSKKFVLRLGLLLVDLGLLVRVDCRLVLVGQRVLLPARPILCCPIVRGVGAFPAYCGDGFSPCLSVSIAAMLPDIPLGDGKLRLL